MASAGAATSDAGWKDARDWIQLIVIVFVALSGSYQFVYKDYIKPGQEPTALELSTGLENIAEQGGMFLIRARITAVNPTNRRIYVPAFWFNAIAVKLSNIAHRAEPDQESIKRDPLRLVGVYGQTGSRQLVAHQRIVARDGAWWEPKDKTHNEAIFAVPKGEFDYLEMKVFYLYTRFGDVLLEPNWVKTPEGGWDADFKLKPGFFGARDPSKWQEETASGENWAVTALPLWSERMVR